MWHSTSVLLSHLVGWVIIHTPYFYELLSGILLFISSAITEEVMPKTRQKWWHWIVFGGFSLILAGAGIVVRYGEIQQNENTNHQAKEDRAALQESRRHLDDRMDDINRLIQVTYLRVGSFSSEFEIMSKGLTQLSVNTNPKQLAEQTAKAQALSKQASAYQKELLALTMAPQTAEQLRDWEGDLKAKQQDLHNRSWEEEQHFKWEHPTDTNGLQAVWDKWEKEYEAADREYAEKEKGIWTYADFVRTQLLQRIPPEQQYAEDEKDFTSRTREDAARYLENLAKRVPPPPRISAVQQSSVVSTQKH
jgi:hypothetical protein